eukprot:Skav217376  [mRNA]  locus=scaffold5994:42570:42857:- [translate_table: standard]
MLRIMLHILAVVAIHGSVAGDEGCALQTSQTRGEVDQVELGFASEAQLVEEVLDEHFKDVNLVGGRIQAAIKYEEHTWAECMNVDWTAEAGTNKK